MPTLLALDRVLTRPTNEQFGRYQLLGRLGAGGMAEVFVARCGELAGMQSLVAVKRILPHLAEDEAFVSLFRREAQISLRLRHRAIARVVEVGRAGGAWFLAMELVPGESLAHLLRAERERRVGPDPRLVAWVGAEIASALHHAHTLSDGGAPLRVIHRDVSPQNLLLGFDGAAKLIDFGVARCARLSDATRTGTVRGKLAYASPEQLAARPLDARSDLFSLAVVLHEWLAGVPLFERESDAATVQAVQTASIAPLARAPQLDAVLARALARAPERRFPDGEALGEALLAAVGGRPPAPERLVAAHLHTLFPDREARWQAIVAGRKLEADGRATENQAGATVASGAVLRSTVPSSSASSSSSASVLSSSLLVFDPGPRTRARRRTRRIAVLAVAAAAGFASLVLGWVHRGPASAGGAAAPLVSRAGSAATAGPRSPPQVAAAAVGAPAPPAADEGAPAPVAVSAVDRPQRPMVPGAAARRRVRHPAAPAARRAIVDELEPSPYKSR
jgi:serine/threonine protein kinase